MKKKWIKMLCVAIALILLFPVPIKFKDGGTVEYTAILYKVSDVHSLAHPEDVEKGQEFYEGIIIEILGFQIYNNVNSERYH